MNEKQQKSFDRRLQRAVARSGNDEDEKLSLFIRVAESRIYNGKPVLKALLKEVIFMRMRDLHENDLRIPKWTPWSKDYRKYEGWCYASQEYLAGRVGCEHTYANKALKKIIKDGYLKSRRWRDKNGRWHKQYFPDESAIDAAIAGLDAEDAAELGAEHEGTDKSVPTPHLSLKPLPTCDKDNQPPVIKASAHLSLKQNPLVISASKEVSGGSFSEDVDLVRRFSQPPPSSGIDVTVKDSPASRANKTNPAGANGSQAKKEAKATTTPKPKKIEPTRCGNPDCLELLVPGEAHVCWEEGTPKVEKAKSASVPAGAEFDEEEA
jgi:hypothetical protein